MGMFCFGRSGGWEISNPFGEEAVQEGYLWGFNWRCCRYLHGGRRSSLPPGQTYLLTIFELQFASVAARFLLLWFHYIFRKLSSFLKIFIYQVNLKRQTSFANRSRFTIGPGCQTCLLSCRKWKINSLKIYPLMSWGGVEDIDLDLWLMNVMAVQTVTHYYNISLRWHFI